MILWPASGFPMTTVSAAQKAYTLQSHCVFPHNSETQVVHLKMSSANKDLAQS